MKSERKIPWPQSVPRHFRKKTNARGCFYIRRRPASEEELQDARVDLSGNLMVVALRGGAVFRRGQETVVLREGEACLIGEGQFSISELPTTSIASCDILYVFFGDKVIRQCFSEIGEIERRMLAMSFDSDELCRLPKFLAALLPVMHGTGLAFPHDFSRILAFCFNRYLAGSWLFLRPFFARRRSLHLHLEQYVNTPFRAETIESQYPSGPRDFRRDFRAHHDISLERWLIWRRLQMARVWIRHGTRSPISEVAQRFGYRNLESFRHRFRSRFGIWPEEVPRMNDLNDLSPENLRGTLVPFWHWSFSTMSEVSDQALAFHHRYNGVSPRRRRFRDRFPIYSKPENSALFDVGAGELQSIDPPPEIGITKFVELEDLVGPLEADPDPNALPMGFQIPPELRPLINHFGHHRQAA